jgi:hypothetical protein
MTNETAIIETTEVATTEVAATAPAAKPKRKPAAKKVAEAKAEPAAKTTKARVSGGSKRKSTAPKVAVAKAPRSRVLNKKQKTQNLIIRELEKVNGDYDKLNRKSITNRMVSTFNMTERQASTYYHNYLRSRRIVDSLAPEDRGDVAASLYVRQTA